MSSLWVFTAQTSGVREVKASGSTLLAGCFVSRDTEEKIVLVRRAVHGSWRAKTEQKGGTGC